MRKEEPQIMSLLTISHLSAGYGRKEILHDISFTSRPGTITGILGANGCGKTTLLKAIANILPHKGSCRKYTGITFCTGTCKAMWIYPPKKRNHN